MSDYLEGTRAQLAQRQTLFEAVREAEFDVYTPEAAAKHSAAIHALVEFDRAWTERMRRQQEPV